MDAEGLITRRRDTTNRRVHVVELTDVGEETFLRLRTAAVAFDQRLRAGITEKEVASLEDVLDRLVRNVAPDHEPGQWAGLLEANRQPVPTVATIDTDGKGTDLSFVTVPAPTAPKAWPWGATSSTWPRCPGPDDSGWGQQALDESGQQPLDPRFDVDHGVG
jgi:hypothetical protein